MCLAACTIGKHGHLEKPINSFTFANFGDEIFASVLGYKKLDRKRTADIREKLEIFNLNR